MALRLMRVNPYGSGHIWSLLWSFGSMVLQGPWSWYPDSHRVQLCGCGEGPGCENIQEAHQLPLLQRLDLCLRSPESDIKGGPGQLMGSGWFWIWGCFDIGQRSPHRCWSNPIPSNHPLGSWFRYPCDMWPHHASCQPTRLLTIYLLELFLKPSGVDGSVQGWIVRSMARSGRSRISLDPIDQSVLESKHHVDCSTIVCSISHCHVQSQGIKK